MMRSPRMLAGLVLLLAACGEPPAARTPDGLIMEPMPAMPAWVADYVGKSIPGSFPPAEDTCDGYVDAVAARYGGPEGGVRVDGWGWSRTRTEPFARYVVVDDAGVIKGGGEGGIDRADVPAAIPAVTSPSVGYSVLAKQTTGAVRVFALTPEGAIACQIGSPFGL